MYIGACFAGRYTYQKRAIEGGFLHVRVLWKRRSSVVATASVAENRGFESWLPDFFGTANQNWKNIPYDHQMYQIANKAYHLAVKETKLPQKITYIYVPLQDLPKFNKIGIFGLKIYHLATLV
jgi:hypothetical protein